MSISRFLTSSAVVQQLTTSKTPMGGLKKDYSTTRISDLRCRFSTRNIREVDQYGKMTIREILRLYCLATSTNRAIETSDRITFDSRTFEITGIHNPAQLNRHLQIDLSEVT